MAVSDGLAIGMLAERTGLAVSAIRYYEEQGLIRPWRNAGGQRRFGRADIRRLSFVMIAQKIGLTLPEIRALLDTLPGGRTPNKRDWEKMAAAFRAHLDARIAELEHLRDNLDGCIGCGCLSLPSCALYNPKDRMAARGTGPRFLLGDAYEPAEAPG
ncbi:redox-sensitive transcriptional activator SoxR [Chachezhania antarctica]|uniref:redox-sensitive transcriptional activator SoxR n=1 Tax=Chachezhania antarctica TaxID=2340860 RepID=UPI000EACC9B4|nr:redox-sensitive transcriptional activator SoxR [Chachezhania antarctica]|tara:strand:- start:768 stop:1238 length:471 start_codon:yes stop_codon:yes gene_type:complete